MAKAKKAEEEEEFEEELEDGDEQETEKPKGKLFSWLKLPSLAMPSRKVMIIAAAGLLVLGGGGGAYFYFFSSSEHEAPAKHAAKPVKPATFVDLPDVLVNLSNGANERTQYLKVKIVLEVPTPEVVAEIQPLMPRVLDTFQTYLRELRADRSRRLRGPLPAQGGIDPAGQCGRRAEPRHRRSLQRNHRSVTD